MSPEQATPIIENWMREDVTLDVRQLPDGSLAMLGRLLYTTAVYTGLDMWGYEHRFCFKDPALARAQFEALQSAEDEPTGYVARR